MNKQILGNLLREQLEDVSVSSEPHIPRELSLKKQIGSKEITIVTGVRRCGKSSLLKQHLLSLPHRDSVIYMDFDDPRFESFQAQDFEKVYTIATELQPTNRYSTAIFDEIQNVDGWEKWMNFFATQKQFNVFITGSNSRMLSSELATRLTGRHRDLTLYPMSFREIVSHQAPQLLKLQNSRTPVLSTSERAKLVKIFKAYFQFGGFPRVWQTKDLVLLSEYYTDILNRDIIRRHHIRHQRQLSSFGLALMSDIGRRLNKSKLASTVEIKQVNTVNQYFSHFTECYLGFELRKFDTSIRRALRNPVKFYAIDHALARRVGVGVETKESFYSENMVFIELIRRGNRVSYWQEGNGPEIDFVVEEPTGKKTLVQVSWSVEDVDTLKREVPAFEGFQKRFPNIQIHRKLIIIAEFTPAVRSPKGVDIISFTEWALRE